MAFDGWDSELCHHGIKGQKWGVRRFQNEDGSWTAAGEARYGKDFRSKGGRIAIGLRTKLTDSDRKYGLGSGDLREGRVSFYENRVAKYANKKHKSALDKKMEKRANLKLRAQNAANFNRETYEARTSIATLWMQNKIFGNKKATLYRDARARGSGKVRSFVESSLSNTPIGLLMRRSGDKKTYGTHVRW